MLVLFSVTDFFSILQQIIQTSCPEKNNLSFAENKWVLSSLWCQAGLHLTEENNPSVAETAQPHL